LKKKINKSLFFEKKCEIFMLDHYSQRKYNKWQWNSFNRYCGFY